MSTLTTVRQSWSIERIEREHEEDEARLALAAEEGVKVYYYGVPFRPHRVQSRTMIITNFIFLKQNVLASRTTNTIRRELELEM